MKNLHTGFRWQNQMHILLLLSLGMMMVMYMVCRMAFYLFNMDYFPDMDVQRMFTIITGGLRFDLTAILYTNSLFILMWLIPAKIKFRKAYLTASYWIFIVTNSVALLTNMADFIFYRFTLRRTSLQVLDQFENEQNVAPLMVQFVLDFWYIFLLWIGLVAALVYLSKKIHGAVQGPQVHHNGYFHGGGFVVFCLGIFLFVTGARSSFIRSTRPITLSNAAAYAKTPNDINLVLNTPFVLLLATHDDVVKKVDFFADEAAANVYFNPVKYSLAKDSFQAENVVIIILESFSKEFVGAFNRHLDGGKYQGYTPYLDSLISVGLSFEYSMANGRKSIDALPSSLASIPYISVPYVLSSYSGNTINSLPSLLKNKGYTSLFFHGAPNGSMGFDAFANLCGFDRYYGKDEYNRQEDYDGIWGIWDEPFLQYTAGILQTTRQPFLATVFTLSSHHPYNLPAEYENTFTGGKLKIHRTIQYTDYALRKFMETAEKMPWFKNTLFVFTADHASAEIGYEEYNTLTGYMAVPVFFYKPGENWGGVRRELFQQIDIMPTVLGYLRYDKPYLAYGRDYFRKEEPYVFSFLNEAYQYFQGQNYFRFNGKNITEYYNFVEDPFLKNNLVSLYPDSIQKYDPVIKAFVQQFNNRMIDNRLTVDD